MELRKPCYLEKYHVLPVVSEHNLLLMSVVSVNKKIMKHIIIFSVVLYLSLLSTLQCCKSSCSFNFMEMGKSLSNVSASCFLSH